MKSFIPFNPGQPFTTAEATKAGLSHRRVMAAVAEGQLIKDRYGWFHLPAPDESRAQAAVRASKIALVEGPNDAVISHHTAARLHGLPLVRARSDRAHLTIDRPTGGRKTRHVYVHTSPASSLTSTEVCGIPVTGIERTIVDLARSAGFDTGVCAADHALRKHLVTRRSLMDELELHRGRTGVAIAREVIKFADPLAESPGESLSRCLMRSLGTIPEPRLQHQYLSAEGHHLARADFSWGDGALAGEFDGRIKYAGSAADGADPGEVVWREKLREDRLRELGVVVIRWVWNDLFAPKRFEQILLGGLRRAQLR